MRYVGVYTAAVLIFALGVNLCSGDEASYTVTFQGNWTLEPLPNGAHFTPIIGATHGTPGAILTVGELATQGVENVAETGSTTALINEINAGIAAGTVGGLVSRPGNVGPSTTVTFNFTVTPEHSLFTLLTMIAPSPDWFVGVHDLDLRDGNQWRDKIIIELNSYDAGTEEGSLFSLSNLPTVPQEVIQPLDLAESSGPLNGFGSVATVTITRTDIDLFILGDVNSDGIVDLLDVSVFVVLVSAQVFLPAADINCDDSVDLLDVAPFVELLTGN